MEDRYWKVGKTLRQEEERRDKEEGKWYKRLKGKSGKKYTVNGERKKG